MNKNNLFFVVFILNAQVFNSSYAVGKTAAEILSDSMDRNTDKLGKLAPTIGEKAGKDFKDGATVLSKSIDRGVSAAIGIAIGAAVGGTVYYVVREGKIIAKWWWPEDYEDKEELLRIKKAVREAQIMDLEGKLSESLAKHAFEDRNKMGIPSACAEDANKYAAVAGIKALATVVEKFKESCAIFNSEKQIA